MPKPPKRKGRHMSLTVSDQGAERILVASWCAPVALGDAMTAPLGPPEIAVSVYANHGRWIVECPDCAGAQIASAHDYRFMCHCCGNAAVENLWRPVIWPEEAVAIDEVLSSRPTVNQNWTPGETVDDLLAEQQEGEAV